MDNRDLYSAAVDQWGSDLQIGMLHEEIGELLQALNKLRRHANGSNISMREDLAEELADVHIMLEQVSFMFNLDSDVVDWKVKKLKRLADMLGVNS